MLRHIQLNTDSEECLELLNQLGIISIHIYSKYMFFLFQNIKIIFTEIFSYISYN